MSTIVNNDSSGIICMFNTTFNDPPAGKAALDLYPESLRAEIEDVNAWVYDTVNSASCSSLLFILYFARALFSLLLLVL